MEKKNEHKKTCESLSSTKKRKDGKTSKASKDSGTDGKLRQPTIFDVLKKPGATTSQGTPNGDSSALSSKCRTSESADQHGYDTNKNISLEVSAIFKVLEAQRSKFRPLLVDCFSILTFSTVFQYILHHCTCFIMLKVVLAATCKLYLPLGFMWHMLPLKWSHLTSCY